MGQVLGEELQSPEHSQEKWLLLGFIYEIKQDGQWLQSFEFRALQKFTWSGGSAALWRPSGCIKASHALPGLWPLPVCIKQMSKQLTNLIRRMWRWMHFKEQLRSEDKILFNEELKFQAFVCCASAEIPEFYPLFKFLWRLLILCRVRL